jgi:four helix bundle protein
MALVTEVDVATREFPREELYGLTSQMRRCAVSIPCNIAEGHARTTRKDYGRFLDIAVGSLSELQTQLEIARNLQFLAGDLHDSLQDRCRELERMLSSLIRKLRTNRQSPE